MAVDNPKYELKKPRISSLVGRHSLDFGSRKSASGIISAIKLTRIALIATLTLLICCVNAQDKPSASDFYIWDLPGLDKSTQSFPVMHSGRLAVNPDHNGNLFFWSVRSKYVVDTPKTVIWLNGGPGCSSLDGALMEIGPYRLKDANTLVDNAGSWHQHANLLFVDQPIGVGLSTADTDSYIHELPEMARDMLTFLDRYLHIFPEHINDEFYIAGESYAGQYIPYLAKAILDRNIELENSNSKTGILNLRGIMIGNGWIDPIRQYLTFVPFIMTTGLVSPGSDEAQALDIQHKRCAQILSDSETVTIHNDACEEILQTLLQGFHRNTGESSGSETSCLNVYDIRLTDSYPSCGMNWPPDLTYLTPYLRREDVLKALHAYDNTKEGWKECSGPVGSAFKARQSTPSIELFPDILEKIPVILFNGDKDLICNHMGNEALIKNLQWNGHTGYSEDDIEQEWLFDNVISGTVQSARNLSYVRFYNSSHMVPYDFPEKSRLMLNNLLGVQDWQGNSIWELPVSNSTKAQDDEKEKIVSDATWKAYYRAGEVTLVFVIIITGLFMLFLWRSRQKRRYNLSLQGNRFEDQGDGFWQSLFGGVSRWKPKHHGPGPYEGLSGSQIRLAADDEIQSLEEGFRMVPLESEHDQVNGSEFQELTINKPHENEV